MTDPVQKPTILEFMKVPDRTSSFKPANPVDRQLAEIKELSTIHDDPKPRDEPPPRKSRRVDVKA